MQENYNSYDVAKSLEELEYDIATTGKLFSELDKAASLLERSRTIFRAQLANNIQREQRISRREAETQALTSVEYSEFIDKMLEARKNANIAKVNWQVAIARHNGARTVESTRRAEMLLR